MPPPVDEVPAVENRPPRLVPTTPNPLEGPVRINQRCDAEYRFYARASDEDGDTLFWRVFLDYHRDNREPPLVAREVAAESQFTIDFRVHPDKFGPQASLEEPHTVELLLSDRAFVEYQWPYHRATEEDGLTDLFVWPVQLVDEHDPPCPSSATEE